MPAAAPRMSRQGTYNVALMTYNVPVENLNVGVSASDASGVSHPVGLAILGRTPIDESGRVTLVLQVKPTQLVAGRYSMSFNVARKGSSPTTVWLPVEVQ